MKNCINQHFDNCRWIIFSAPTTSKPTAIPTVSPSATPSSSPTVAPTSEPTQNIAACALNAAFTNIGSVLPAGYKGWNCDASGKPTTSVCGQPWTGITCNTCGEVSQIQLASYGITGSIPTKIGFLSSLVTLNLVSNKLTGSIPVQIAQLTKLTLMNLYGNSLGGAVPDLSGALKLSSILLGSNSFSGTLPANMCGLPLTLFELRSNSMTVHGDVCFTSGSLAFTDSTFSTS